MQSTRTCTIDGCDKPHKARGLCNPHYMKMYDAGLLKPMSKTNMDRFLSKTDKNGPIPAHAPELGPCWIWTASHSHDGYARFYADHVMGYAHKWIYEQHHGSVGKGIEVDHICWTRNCVNPNHLRAVSKKQNIENFSGLLSNNTSGFRGISLDRRRNLWRARVKHNNKEHWLGYFKTAEEAAEAARDARLRLFTCNTLDKLGVL